MLTQIMVDAQFQKKGFQSIATKILLQMLAKRGNILWVPRPQCEIENIMLIAYDTAKCKSQTMISLCATINSTFSSIFSATRLFQDNNDKYGKMV